MFEFRVKIRQDKKNSREDQKIDKNGQQ